MPSLSERLQAARNRRAQAERPIDPSVVAAQPAAAAPSAPAAAPVGAGAVRPPRGRRASAAEPDALPTSPVEARFTGPLATEPSPSAPEPSFEQLLAEPEVAAEPTAAPASPEPAVLVEPELLAEPESAGAAAPIVQDLDPETDRTAAEVGEVEADDEEAADAAPVEDEDEDAPTKEAAEEIEHVTPDTEEPTAEDAQEAEADAEDLDPSDPIAEPLDGEQPTAEPAEDAEPDWTPEWDSAEGPGWGSAAEPEPSWLAEAREEAGATAPASAAPIEGQPSWTADPEFERILAGHDATELVDPALVSPQPVQPVVLGASAPSMPPVEDLYDGAALAVIPRSDDGGGDEVQRVREEASDLFAERIGTRLNDPSLSEGDLDTMARRELASIIDERGQTLSERERFALIQELADEVLGLGPIEPLLDDESVSEVMVNGHDHIYVERRGRIQRVPTSFRSEERLRRVIERIVTRVGRRIDESSPLVDARLADGSRVNAVIPPLAIGGSSLTIRKFAAEPLRARDLVSLGTVSDDMVQLLIACVRARLNVIVSGGTGTGKTTLLNVLSSFIPHDERIITIEDAAELQLQQEHVVRLESRPANLEGRGEVTIRDLVRNALRMRPDRIVVGESRGGESLDMLQAMSTGHDGSLTTLHANSPRDAIARLETLVMMAGMDLPHRAIREQIASAVDVIIQVTRLRDGTRRVTHVSEILGMENDIVTLQDVYRFDFGAGVDHSGRFLGKAQPTGIRPRFLTRFDELGVPFDASLFTTAADRADWA